MAGIEKRRSVRKKLDSEKKNLNVTLTGHERIMEDGTALVTMTDLTGKITYANHEFAKITGMEVSELMGKPHSLIRHPDMPRSAFQDFWETIQAGDPWNGMVKNRASTGDHYWVDANASPRIENGVHTGYISVRRKPAREKVEKADRLYKDILNGRTQFPWTDSKMISVRSRFAVLVGIIVGAVVINEALDFVIPDVWWAHLITAGLSLVPALYAFFLMQSILKPLDRAVELGNQIATGDLTAAIPHNRNDEIGRLQKSMLNMLINTAGMVARIKESTMVLGDAARGLNEASQSLSADTHQSSTQSESIAASATQMNQNLQVISSSAEEMSISIGEVARKAAEAAQIAGEANRTAQETDGVVKRLGESAHEIGKVIETISGIAAQTNLLALNAAIEAAGAGEAGRGFAVVAGEVKELARQSSKASDEIKQKITAIQKSTDTAVGAIQTIADVVKRINEINSAIASAVEEQSITTKEIANNVSQSSLASREVTKNIEGVSSAAKLGAQDAAKTSRMAGELQAISLELQKIAGAFKV